MNPIELRTSSEPEVNPSGTSHVSLEPPTPNVDLQASAASLQQILGNRYEILQPIAIGGMAILFKMRHRLHGGLCVAKLLHVSVANQPQFVEAFCCEARHVALLGSHPNIVPVVDLLKVNGVPCIVMPYIEGEDLDHLFARNGKLQRDEALMLVAQLASLLMWSETLGIVHGDLAPGNIRLDPFGQYRVLDFGLSRRFLTSGADLANPPIRAGTPAYNSPEQLRGDPLDIRTDLYAVGVILAEALTAQPLFQATTLDALAEKHLRGDWALPPEILADRPIAELICALVVADRDCRMRSAFELSGAVAALGFELPSFNCALSRSPLRVPRIRRRRLEVI